MGGEAAARWSSAEVQQYMRQAKRRRIYAERASEVQLKQPHLNSAKMRIQVCNILTTNVLQGFLRQCPRFRCSVGVKHPRVQTCPAGTSEKGSIERHCKTPHASEPEQKPQISSQLTEKLLVAEIRQEFLRVQMHRKTTASELCKNADSSTQHANNKRIERISAAIPKVQMLSGSETPTNANPPCRHLWKGSHRKAPQTAHASEPE